MGLLNKAFNPKLHEEGHPVVKLHQVELLVPEQILAQNVSAEEVSRLVRATEECVRQTLPCPSKTFGLRVRYTIYTNRPVGIDLGVNTPIDQGELQPTYEAINGLDAVHIQARRQPVLLNAYFTISQS